VYSRRLYCALCARRYIFPASENDPSFLYFFSLLSHVFIFPQQRELERAREKMKGMDMYRATDGPSFFFFFFFCIPRAGSFRSPQYIFVFRLSPSAQHQPLFSHLSAGLCAAAPAIARVYSLA
jgi:hypothetical protein